MTLPRCFLCKRMLLELEGQDGQLQPYLLKSGDAQDAVGSCHYACLVHSAHGALWAERRIEHGVITVGLREVAEAEHLTALVNPRTEELSVIRSDGVLYSFTRRESLAGGEPTPGGVLLPVQHELNLELPEERALVLDVNQTFAAREPFPLMEIVDRLALRDTLLAPQALAQGELRRSRTPVPAPLRERWISAQAAYARFIPEEVVRLVHRVRGRRYVLERRQGRAAMVFTGRTRGGAVGRSEGPHA